MPTVTVFDRQLHYSDEGSGDDPLVLVHAVPLDAAMWEPQVQALRTRCRIIALDLAGFGLSEPLGDPQAFSVEAWADDVIALVSALGLDHITLVGASTGADVALAVARRARDVVGGLGLSGLRPASQPNELLQTQEQADWLAGGGDRQSVVDRFVDAFVGRDSTRRSEVAKLARWMMERTPTAGWVGGLGAIGRRPDPVPDLSKLDVPVLFIAGEHDELAPPGIVREMAGEVPGAGFIEVPDTGHLPNLENPVVFDRALQDLLEGREARRSPGKHAWPATPAAH
jgi:pimeloyl-ACP methyl ester carboxylesterase